VEASPRDAALALAREIAQRSPSAIRAGKRLLNASVTASLDDGMRLEERLQRELIGSPNQLEAVQANLEQRPPRFTDPE
jgi:enoyl-CoA hydratase/carnithine racemase